MKLIRYHVGQKLKITPYAQITKHITELAKLGIVLDMDNGPWIAGGSLLRMLFTGEFPSNKHDIDIFLPKDFDTSVLKVKEEEDDLASSDYGGKNFSLSALKGLDGYKYQLIHTQKSGIKDILEDFDLTCVQLATDGKVLIISDEALYDIERGEIKKTGKGWHHATPHRIEKFKAIGMTYREPAPKPADNGIPF